MQKKYRRLNPDKVRVRWEIEEGEGFRIYLETHMMASAPTSCHLTLTLTPTLTTSTSKWFLAIAMAMTTTMKSKSKSRLPEASQDMGPRRDPRRGSKLKLNKHLWEQISSEIWEIDHPLCAPTSGGTCLKSSRRVSTKIEEERRKRKRKKKEKRENGRRRKIWGRRK